MSKKSGDGTFADKKLIKNKLCENTIWPSKIIGCAAFKYVYQYRWTNYTMILPKTPRIRIFSLLMAVEYVYVRVLYVASS
jgi:hypothetical protein